MLPWTPLTTHSHQGGLITYTANELNLVNQATANFAANNKDPKAQIITTYNCIFGEVRKCSVSFANLSVDDFRHSFRNAFSTTDPLRPRAYLMNFWLSLM